MQLFKGTKAKNMKYKLYLHIYGNIEIFVLYWMRTQKM